MAISQKKLHSVLTLTRKFIAAYEGQTIDLQDAIGAFDTGKLDYSSFVDRCRELTLTPAIALAPLIQELEREEMHYALTHKRNEAERQRKQRLRHDIPNEQVEDDISSADLLKVFKGE